MKLSSKAITNAFNLRKSKELVIQCFASKDRISDINEIIMKYNRNSTVISEITENNKESLNTDGLLINLERFDSNNVLELEKYLISSKRVKTTILDICGVNLCRDKRDLVLSFLSRYDIDIIKGTDEEVLSLINGQKYYKSLQDDKYRDFSRKNNAILIVKGDNYWITDGYSEFTININSNSLYNDLAYENILNSIIITSASSCENKEQKVEAVLLSITTFEICKQLAVSMAEIDGSKEYLKKYLIDKIGNIDSNEIYKLNNIVYKFKR